MQKLNRVKTEIRDAIKFRAGAIVADLIRAVVRKQVRIHVSVKVCEQVWVRVLNTIYKETK